MFTAISILSVFASYAQILFPEVVSNLTLKIENVKFAKIQLGLIWKIMSQYSIYCMATFRLGGYYEV